MTVAMMMPGRRAMVTMARHHILKTGNDGRRRSDRYIRSFRAVSSAAYGSRSEQQG